MRKTNTKLLAISITTAAIIAAVTTTSLSAATPAFAKRNCTDIPTGGFTCTGGVGFTDRPGGFGGRETIDFTTGERFVAGGTGGNDGNFAGGEGGHLLCDPDCNRNVGGGGGHGGGN
jgi:hypothetical protein